MYESISDLKSTIAGLNEVPRDRDTITPNIVTNEIYVLTIPYSSVVNNRVKIGIVRNAIALLNKFPTK
jgi:hypothetical protein